MNGLQFHQLFGLGCSVNKPAPHLAPRRLCISVEPECLRGQTAMNSPVVSCLLSQLEQR